MFNILTQSHITDFTLIIIIHYNILFKNSLHSTKSYKILIILSKIQLQFNLVTTIVIKIILNFRMLEKKIHLFLYLQHTLIII